MSGSGTRPFVVGLTGGISSGKSAVSDRLRTHGAHVIDTDQIARDLVEPGSACLDAIRARFGDNVIGPDGRLDRAHMRQLITRDPASRQALESILHPAIRTEVLRQVSECDSSSYCVVVIPLLVENLGAYGWLDGIIVVDTDPARQVERLMRRDGVDAELARKMLDMQASRETRLAAATWVIDNNGSVDNLMSRVDALHVQLESCSRSRPQPEPSKIKRVEP